MDILSVRRQLAYTGEEKYQMLELNRRLESYLGHVKLLEEENQLLWREIQVLQRSQSTESQRKAQNEAVSLARKEVQNAWREKDCLELEISNLLNQIEELNILRQKEKLAQAEAKQKLEESKKMLEDEQRAQIWLRDRAVYLEREVSLQVQIQHEDMENLKSSIAHSKPVLMTPQHSQTLNLHELGEEYSQKAAQAWRQAAAIYESRMEKMEINLNHARAQMAQVNQEKRENQLQVQALAKDLDGAKIKNATLEKNVVMQRDRQNQELQHLQTHIEALEAEKVEIELQMGDLMVNKRNLHQMKVSLDLEVATYRALLDNESMRTNNISRQEINRPLERPRSTQSTLSFLFNSPWSSFSKSLPHKTNLMTPQQTSMNGGTFKKEKVTIEEKMKPCLSTATLKNTPECKEVCVEASYAATNEHETLSTSVETDLHKSGPESEQIWSGTSEVVSIDLVAEHVSSPQTPDREMPTSRHMEEAKSLEEGDDEETEVSTEMAQISHAPMSAWEENDAAIPEDREVSEPYTENIIDNDTNDIIAAALTKFKQLNEDVIASSLLKKSPLSEDTFDNTEESSEILTWADVKETVIHFVEEDSLKGAPEIERELTGAAEPLEGCGTDIVEDTDFQPKMQEEDNKIESEVNERQTEQRMKEDMVDGNKQECFMEEDIPVMDYTEQEAKSQGSFVLQADSDKHLDHTEQKANLEVGENDGDDKLDKCHAEEVQALSDEDESLNISASWRTDPGEVDSYAQENTLADTRPLIHYKSDEETDGNNRTAHRGMADATDSEEEGEKREGVSFWSQKITKRFDTMEDLSEEPEMSNVDDETNYRSVQTVVEGYELEGENADSEETVQLVAEGLFHRECGDEDKYNILTYGADDQESFLKNHTEDGGHDEGVVNKEDDVLPMSLEGNSQYHNWSESFLNKNHNIEQQTFETEQSTINKEDYTKENPEVLDFTLKEKAEAQFDHFPFATEKLLSESLEGQSLKTEQCEFLFETTMVTEETCPKKEVDDYLNQLVLPPEDFTDSVSQESKVNSQPENQENTGISILEESNSSDDDSSNASQCSQPCSYTDVPNTQLDRSMTADEGTQNNSMSSTAFSQNVLTLGSEIDSTGQSNVLQFEESENVMILNKDDHQDSMKINSDGIILEDNSLSQTKKGGNINHPCEIQGASYCILDEHDNMEVNNQNKMDIIQDNGINIELQSQEKENDPHYLFSSSIEKCIWNTTNFEMSATYDPNNQLEIENDVNNTINPKPDLEEDWAIMSGPPAANNQPETNISISLAVDHQHQTTAEEMKVQEFSQAKLQQCKDGRDGDLKTVHTEESDDEGNSWSSGEE